MFDWRSLLQPQPDPAGYQPQLSNAYQALAQIGAQTQRQELPPPPALLNAAPPAPSANPTPSERQGRTVLVGDSLGVGTSPYLQGVKANAVVGRSSASGVQALRQFATQGQLGRVLFDLGTNDASAQDLAHSIRQARHLAPGAAIYVPTVNGPGAAGKNALLRQLDREGRITLIDTTGLRTGPDGIHLDAAGYKRRAELIRAALR